MTNDRPVQVRMPTALYRRLVSRAKRERRTVGDLARLILADYLAPAKRGKK